ncbi:lysophospholipase [Glaciecola punicea ACAM 611]|uniref:Lysophospholipase n=1 Tax=Glaciecola punicea ACAM 611 TaxID=1121923 RepID=H5TEY8_9ALTE|nr:alpha/beta fold hydrolase [Glaciecola punicea]GAB56915.1 lysophospholipase [Glaciecola punicea ACAM 611]
MTYYISLENKVSTYPQTDFMAFFNKKVRTGIWQQRSAVDTFYGYVINASASKCIVISQGRSESLVKYAEFIYELYQNGYTVFMLDHQGQGQSTRLLPNPHIGYVKSFNDYVEDLHEVIENVLNPLLTDNNQGNLQKILFCHSMGGAIGSMYVLAHPTVFTKLVMTAPMLGILIPVSESLTYLMVKTVLGIRAFFGLPLGYLWGQTNYEAGSFNENKLTNSELRYGVFRDMMTLYSQNQLGGISFTWMQQAITAMRDLRLKASSIMLPTLVFQAEQERIVDNKKMTQFVAQLANATLVKVANAQHELLLEQDEARTMVLSNIYDFIESDHNH